MGLEPREWFLVPLPVIDQAIGILRAGDIGRYEYDPTSAQIVEVGATP